MEVHNLQIAPNGVSPIIHVSQYDVGRQFQLKLYDGATAYSVPSGATATINGIKPDNKGFSYADAVSISGSTVTVTTKEQMTIVEGIVECEIRFTQNGLDIGTLNFKMMVEKSPINQDTDISETELPAIFALAEEQMLSAEAWAKGTRNGLPVPSTAPQHENNSKYWSEESNRIGEYWNDKTNLDGEAWTRGTRNGVEVPITDETYHNNSKYYSEQSANSATASANSASASATSASASAASATNSSEYATLSESWAIGGTNTRSGEDTNNSKYWCNQAENATSDIVAYIAIIKLILGIVYLLTEDSNNLITEDGDKIIIDF